MKKVIYNETSVSTAVSRNKIVTSWVSVATSVECTWTLMPVTDRRALSSPNAVFILIWVWVNVGVSVNMSLHVFQHLPFTSTVQVRVTLQYEQFLCIVPLLSPWKQQSEHQKVQRTNELLNPNLRTRTANISFTFNRKCLWQSSVIETRLDTCTTTHYHATLTEQRLDWIGLCSVLRPRQHSIGYMGDGFYRSKDPTNSIKVLKEKAVKENNPKNKDGWMDG